MDFNVDLFFQFWHSLSENNYKNYKNFHPLVPKEWERLKLIRFKNAIDLSLQSEKEIRKIFRKGIFNNLF